MSLKSMLAVAALSIVALAPDPARAAHFDVIYSDHVDLTLCSMPAPDWCFFTNDGADFMLLVNKGPADVAYPEFITASYTATSSEPSIGIDPFVNTANIVTPVHPNEGVGTTGTLGTEVLPSLIQPGETYRNTTPFQVFAFSIGRKSGSYEGPVTINFTMQVGSEIASFVMHIDLHLGTNAFHVLSAARTSSQSGPTAVARMNWGKLKTIYR